MKQFLYFVIFFGIAAPVFSIEFTVAPLYFIDETIDQGRPQNDFQDRLLGELNKITASEQIRFNKAAALRYNPPQSVGDAIVLCRAERAEYLVYGFITRKEQTIQGELRLLDYEKRDVIVNIFAMDSKEKEDELIQDLAGKLLRFVKEAYNIQTEPDVTFVHVQIPLSLGYWLPADTYMKDLLFGIFRIDSGIQVIPWDKKFLFADYFSLGLTVSYQLGRGHYYNAWDHNLTIGLPLTFYRKFSTRYEIFGGFGLLYSLDWLRVKKLYEDPVTETYSAMGLMFNVGWAFHFKEQWFFFIDTRLETLFFKSSTKIICSPSFGFIYRFYSREVLKKW